MASEFAIKPELDPNFPPVPKVWTCPITGMQVPKDPDANLAWRAEMLKMAEEDENLRQDLYTACSQSLLFFINAFAFTLRIFEPSEEGANQRAEYTHLPFVTWEIQDKHLLRIENCIDVGEDLLTDKSRDMGATWDHIAVYAHHFLFRSDESHLLISRKEEEVDILDGQPKNYPFGVLGDPAKLFGKVDYILSRLPEWMLPQMTRKKMHLVNLDNGTRLDGESANVNAGSSNRCTSIFLDEMAKMKEGEGIKRSTRDVTACRLVCSTPNGAGTAYSKWRLSGQIPVFILAWWEHPEKGRERYVIQDDLGRWKIRSPWYDYEATKRSPKEMAIDIDMDHVGSGDTFFEGTIIEEHRMLFATKPPLRCIYVNFKKDVPDADIPVVLQRRQLKKIQIMPNGPLQLWVELKDRRPDQTKTYTVGVDISQGMGASNSVVSIMCNETKEKIAEWVDANTPPYALARIVCAICLWVGGRSRPLLIWENNGTPGFDFGNQIVRTYEYPNVYFDRIANTIGQKIGKRWGWRSDAEKKAQALGGLRRAYAHGGFINHSPKALDEALTYITYESGGLGPAELLEESANARACHGDRVIADMLCVWGGARSPKDRTQELTAPHNTPAHRLKAFQREARIRQKTRHKRFDFTRTT